MDTKSRGWSEIGQSLFQQAGESYIESEFRPDNDPAVQPAVPVASTSPAINQATQRPWMIGGVELDTRAVVLAGAALVLVVVLVAVRRSR